MTISTPVRRGRARYLTLPGLAFLLSAVKRHRARRCLRKLDRRQLTDAGIAFEIAGFGREADVNGRAITNLDSQR